jgi:integrase
VDGLAAGPVQQRLRQQPVPCPACTSSSGWPPKTSCPTR